MPKRSNTRTAIARSAELGRLNRLPCAVRPISTTASTVKAKVATWDCGTYAISRARSRLVRLASLRSPRRNLARLRRQQPKQRLQQRRLAAAVRTQQGQHVAGRKRDVETAADDTVAVADGEVVAGQDHRETVTTTSSTRSPAAR